MAYASTLNSVLAEPDFPGQLQAEKQKQPQVSSELEQLNRAIEFLGDRMRLIDQRLTPVLSQPLPVAGPVNRTADATAVALANAISEMRLKVQAISDHANTILERLEL